MLAFLLLGVVQTAAQDPADSKTLLLYQAPASQKPAAAQPQRFSQDRAVISASAEVAPRTQQAAPPPRTIQQPNDPRQLAPPSRLATSLGDVAHAGNGRDASRLAIPQIDSLATAGTGLAIVMGLFFVCMWLMRRSGPKPTTPLPKEAVAVLGRVPLAARNFAHLIQVGNKLVLVAITPDGVSPITEVTDPGEVERLLGLCLRGNKYSTTAEFHNVLQQLAKEPAKGFLGKEAHTLATGLRR